VIYWFNQENGLFMRFGADGTVVLSERSGIRSFAANNTKWTENQYTPALNYGIRSVWDDRFKEAIWTFIGVRQVGEYVKPTSFMTSTLEGVVLSNTNAQIGFDDILRLFRCTQSHNNTENYEPGVGVDWMDVWEGDTYIRFRILFRIHHCIQ
jgi:hypothetical protein